MKNVIAHCLAEDPELRTRGIKITSAETVIDNLQDQLKKLLESKLDSSSLVIRKEWFQIFTISDDYMKSYEYSKLMISSA